MNKPRIRASSVSRILACPGSKTIGGYGSVDDAATMGTAAHRVAEHVVSGAKWPPAVAIAETYGSDPDRLGWMARNIKRLWDKHSLLFPNATTEVYLQAEYPEMIVTGHVDVLAVPGIQSDAALADWKTSRSEAIVTPQLLTYAMLVEANYGGSKFYGAVMWVQNTAIEGYEWSMEHIEEHRKRLVGALQSDELLTGPGCRWCPGRYKCPAVRDKLNLYHNAPLVTADSVADAYHVMQAISDIGKDLRGVIREAVRQMGPVPLKDGRVLELVTGERTTIRPTGKAMAYLEESFGRGVWAAVKVGATELRRVIRLSASRGQKATAVQNAMAELLDMGAIETREVETLKARRAGANNDDTEDESEVG